MGIIRVSRSQVLLIKCTCSLASVSFKVSTKTVYCLHRAMCHQVKSSSENSHFFFKRQLPKDNACKFNSLIQQRVLFYPAGPFLCCYIPNFTHYSQHYALKIYVLLCKLVEKRGKKTNYKYQTYENICDSNGESLHLCPCLQCAPGLVEFILSNQLPGGFCRKLQVKESAYLNTSALSSLEANKKLKVKGINLEAQFFFERCRFVGKMDNGEKNTVI